MNTTRVLLAVAVIALIGGIIAILLVFTFDSDDEKGEIAISAGAGHSCVLRPDGSLRCWGLNGTGQLGNDQVPESFVPLDVAGMSRNVVAVAAGGAHTCGLVLGGGARCWGGNEFGQLGDGRSGTQAASAVPVDVEGLERDVVAIAAGSDHTCALTEAGDVFCWGRNVDGRLGDGTTDDRATPVAVDRLDSDVVAIAAGSTHSCALTEAGAVLCWGGNTFGQLGDGTMTDSATPVQVDGLDSDVVAVTAGSTHTCAVTSGGDAFCWGSNSDGRLGDGTTDDRAPPTSVAGLADTPIVAISAGFNHTCALTAAGGVSCWGGNASGQLGNGETAESGTPVLVSGLSSGVVSVSSGGFHTCALTQDGQVLCWGENVFGQVAAAAVDTCGEDAAAVECSTTPVEVVRFSD